MNLSGGWYASRRLGFVLAGCMAGALGAAAAHAQEPKTPVTRAGAATSNITPWLGLSINGSMNDIKAAHVHDELNVRCMVLDDGRTRVALAVCDACAVPLEVVTRAKARITETTGIDSDHVLISATHTHSAGCLAPAFQSEADPLYTRFAAVKIADGVRRAVTNLEPARVGWGVGQEPDEVFNRRWYLKPGTVPADPFGGTTDRVKMNPPPGSPDLVEPAGPVDPDVAVLFAETPLDRQIALLGNYALHYVGNVGPGHLSADYFGVFAGEVRRLIDAERADPPFVAMLTNGASGDINNINFRTPQPALAPYAKMRLVGAELAIDAAAIEAGILPRSDITLDARTTVLTLHVRKPSSEELERAQAIVAAAGGLTSEMKTLPQIYARETLLLNDYPETVPITIQALRVGDLGIVAIPCEVFVEIGLEIKQKSPLQPTMLIELANGYNGYLPTRKQHELGGYETWRARSSYLEVGAADAITRASLELLAEVARSKPTAAR
jgi:hypothetical protein